MASIRDFEDVLRWYGAADVFSSAARLDTTSVSSGAATAPDAAADADSSSSEDQQPAERFPVANLERILDYMARAIRHRCECACAFCHQSSHSFVIAFGACRARVCGVCCARVRCVW